MEVCASRCSRATTWLGLTALAVLAGGCGQEPPDPIKVEAPPPAEKSKTPASSPVGDRLHQPFTEAVFLEPPEGQLRPPDQTKTGKNVAKLYETIAGRDGVGGLWDKVKFATPAGKRITYVAAIKTDLGNIRIEFLPDIAPNHVRNFVALAMAGYYDGLEFDRTVKEELGDKATFIEYIEAGCPLGKGDPSYGSIGYWLKPELSEEINHEAGTVGAWHAEEVESAACKFYITLGKAPWMDGNWTVFGRVTEGLDVARAIRALPVRRDENDRPERPVVIRTVTIDQQEPERGASAP